jgi:hypothetical protein
VPSTTVYLFQCGASDRYALSEDATGCNLPLDGSAPWLLRSSISKDDLNEETLAAVANDGYCILIGEHEP